MNILIITPIKTGVYKDDTEMFCEGLEKYCGHNVRKLLMWEEKGKTYSNEKISKDIFKNIDVIWAPYEPLIPFAIKFKQAFKIPVVGHFEILPPYKIFPDLYILFKFANMNDPPATNYMFTHLLKYKRYIKYFLSCNVKSVTGPEVVYGMEKLIGGRIDSSEFFIKPYPLDTELLEKYRQKDIKEKNQILHIDRLNEYKRVKHILEAMTFIDNPPKLIIAGSGILEEELKKFVKEKGLDVEFRGKVSDEEKVKLIQESMFLVEPCSVLTPNEGAYFKKLSICYDEHILRERMGDMVYYTANNDIPELVKSIRYFINNPEERKKWGENAHYLLMNDKTHSHKLETASKLLNEMFIEATGGKK